MCEGDGCSRWEFTSNQATATWPDGAIGNLSIVEFPSSNTGLVTIHRKDDTGVGKGIEGTYTGTRKGAIVKGEVSWKWPGHPDGHGDWFAVIMADDVHMVPDAAGKPMPIPSSLVGCEDGRACGAWLLNGKVGIIPGQANLTVERFDDSLIAVRRNEVAGTLNGMEALYVGIRSGKEVRGVAVWKWSGQPPVGVVGWHADLPQPSPPLPPPPPTIAYRPELDGPAPVPPPKTMHICARTCETLTLEGNHYSGVLDDNPKIAENFKIAKWKRQVILEKIQKDDEGRARVLSYQGLIADSHDRLREGQLFEDNLVINEFRATWGNARSAPDLPPAHRSKTHPNILLPPGASEKYASYDAHVRAELMALSWQGPDSYDARRPCKDVSLITDPRVAVDISTFAYRADEVERGNCWAVRAAELHSSDGEMLVALGWFMGWHGKADAARGCKAMESIGTRNVWAMIVLRDCYYGSTDPGFPQDAAKEEQVEQWLDANGEHALSQLGYDDLDVKRQVERQRVLDNPPMRTGYSTKFCQHIAADPNSCKTTGFYSVEDKDKSIDLIELQRRLREIDEKYQAIE